METEESKKATGLDILAGGTNVTVKLLEGSTDTIFVRQLAVKEYGALADVMDDEIGQVALFTGKPKEWAERLSPQSHHELMTAAWRLNGDFFWGWFERRLATMQRLPEKLLGLSASRGGLPKPPRPQG
jgi:hypothetical protein